MFDIEKSHFSLFDLFAYFIPGAITLYMASCFGVIWDIPYDGIENAFDIISDYWTENFSLINSIWFVLMSYVVGHIVSFLSCVTIEAYSHWRYKYPSDFLLERSRLNVGICDENNNSCDIKDFQPIKWVTVILQVMISIVILPITILELLFGELLKFKYYYLKPLDRIYTDVIDDRVTTLMTRLKVGKKLVEESSSDNVVVDMDYHRIAYHYELEKQSSCQKKLDGYIALYDFLRALSLISVGVFWCYLLLLIHHSALCGINFLYLFLISSLPYIVFIMFMKFYRRHTLETFMYLIIDESLIKNKNS